MPSLTANLYLKMYQKPVNHTIAGFCLLAKPHFIHQFTNPNKTVGSKKGTEKLICVAYVFIPILSDMLIAMIWHKII